MAASLPLYVQPPFDPHIRSLTRPFSSGKTAIQRGYMVWDTSQAFPAGYSKGNGPAVVKFLFNPSTVSASYSMASSGAQAAINFPVAADAAQLIVPLEQSVSFSLYFDRTYELWYSNSSTPIQNLGVDVDVMALRQFTGMYAANYTYSSSQVSGTAAGGNTLTGGTT